MIDKIYKLFERLADIGSDKYLHFIVGMMVAAIMRLHVGALAALIFVTIVMIAKESVDHFIRKENFDLTDALFGVMGGALMLILMI
nr:MAG TPA: putative periplasmic lipoprotein [Caudoviricetes sp.]